MDIGSFHKSWYFPVFFRKNKKTVLSRIGQRTVVGYETVQTMQNGKMDRRAGFHAGRSGLALPFERGASACNGEGAGGTRRYTFFLAVFLISSW